MKGMQNKKWLSEEIEKQWHQASKMNLEKSYPGAGSAQKQWADTDKHPVIPLRFWEINDFFKCPVVGMCVTLSEQKQLLKKAGVPIKNIDAFEIHEILVASSGSEGVLSKRMDNLLNRKFGKKAAPLLEMSREAFMTHFKSAFKNGDCTHVLWAAAINPRLTTQLKREIFGDIHMSMHWTGDQSMKLKKELARERETTAELRRQLKETTRFKCTLQKENNRLERHRVDMEKALATLEKEKTVLSEKIADADDRSQIAVIDQENRRLKEQVDALIREAKRNQATMTKYKEKNMWLTTELKRQADANERFRRESRDIVREVTALNSCDAACPAYDLCKKRVLIVGGITRLKTLYRELIEGNGGIFEYHDGYMKKGVKKLESSLRRADVVVCPVNCNSHAACSIVKNLAKKHDKTVHMLPNFSINAVSRVIWGEPTRGTIN